MRNKLSYINFTKTDQRLFLLGAILGMVFILSMHSLAREADACDYQGGALDQAFCFADKLKPLEKEMDQKVQALLKSIHSEDGKDADTEIKNRIIATQEAWLKYREGQCTKYYYSKSPVHSGSDDLAIVLCRLAKTKERMQELEIEKNIFY